MRISFIIIFSLLAISAEAQLLKRKKKGASTPTSQSAGEPTSLAPSSSSKKQFGPKKTKKGKLAEPTYGSEEDYYKRMAELQKTKRKNERMMDKPQYSDPMYFGHKHPPKKRPPGKMKYCKVCGLKH